jgi:cyclohexadienyl dehydratase
MKFLLLALFPYSLWASCLTVGTTGDYTPFSLATKQGPVGFDIELIKQIAKRLGRSTCFVKTSWPTLMHDMQQHKFDLAISGISITKERKKIAYFSLPYITTGKAALYRCQQPPTQLNSSHYTVVYNPGGTNEKYVERYLTKSKKLLHPENLSIPTILLEQKADFFITDLIEAKLLAQKFPQHLCHSSILPNSTQQIAIFVQQKNLRDRINIILKKIKQEPLFNKLLKKYNLKE